MVIADFTIIEIIEISQSSIMTSNNGLRFNYPLTRPHAMGSPDLLGP